MKKDIYELFNDIDIGVEAFEESKVSEFEKQKVKSALRKEIRKPKNNQWKTTLMSVAIVMITISTALFGLSFTTFAGEIPILGNIFKLLNKDGNFENYDENAQNLGLVAEDNGVKIFVEEAVFDGNTVFITYSIESKIDLGEQPFLNRLPESNKEIFFMSGSSNTTRIDQNKYIGIYMVELLESVNNKHQKVDISWNIDQINIKPYATSSTEKVVGNWNFEFSLDAVDSRVQWVNPTKSENVTMLERMNEKSLDVRIEKITYTPMSFTIFFEEYYSQKDFSKWDFVNTKLEVKDDLGNQYSGGVATRGTGWDNNQYSIMNYTDTFKKLDPDANKLIITPIVVLEAADGKEPNGAIYRSMDSTAPQKEYKLDEIVVEIEK